MSASRLFNTLYNLDRAIASAFGAPPQETISSEVGRVKRGEAQGHTLVETWLARGIARALDWAWPHHTGEAIAHADALDKVDNGREQ